MPWRVVKEGSEWCVYKLDGDGDPTGDSLGCHGSQADAAGQVRALYASEADGGKAVKFADGSETEVEGLGMPWGGPFNGRDLDGEFFTAKTDFSFDWFGERPLLYQHGMDKGTKTSVVGRVTQWETKADLGVWVRAQLDKSHEYFDAIKKLIERGKLFFSSGSLPHLVEKDIKTGELKSWPWVELSLTPTPANLLATLGEAQGHFAEAGIKADLSALKGAIAPHTTAKADEGAAWDAGAEVRAADGAVVLRRMHAWVDPEGDPETKQAYKLPHHTASGQVVWHGVAAVGVVLQGGRGGVDIPEGDVAGVRRHMAGHYRQFDKEPPWEAGAKSASEEAHTGLRTHPHKHVNGTEHAHPHAHAEGEESHDYDGHSAKAGKAVPWEDVRAEVEALCRHHMMHANPFEDYGYCYVAATFDDHAILCVSREGAERHWSVGFERGADGHVESLGPYEEVEETYVPREKPAAEMPMGVMAEEVKACVEALVGRTEGLHQRRVKEGRVISTANREKLQETLDSMAGAVERIRALLDLSEPKAKATGDALRGELELLSLYAATL